MPAIGVVENLTVSAEGGDSQRVPEGRRDTVRCIRLNGRPRSFLQSLPGLKAGWGPPASATLANDPCRSQDKGNQRNGAPAIGITRTVDQRPYPKHYAHAEPRLSAAGEIPLRKTFAGLRNSVAGVIGARNTRCIRREVRHHCRPFPRQ